MKKQNPFRNIPSVSKLLENERIKKLIHHVGRELTVYGIRRVLEEWRAQLDESATPCSEHLITERVHALVQRITQGGLKSVVNATGIILHTNLGRAPLGPYILDQITPVVLGYSNLEYDLENTDRGHRDEHVTELLRYITGAEDALVVNNNAAGIILALMTLASGKEVIISRGELIEIGGSFRIPEIMAASSAIMREVGTTNKTRISDYEKAIDENTGLIFKAHQSNFAIKGFTEEVSLEALSTLARQHQLPFIYDLGSGLLIRPAGLDLTGEPDVKSALAAGADLVLFSGDKLPGGPQSGIIAGKKDLIAKLAKAPLMRALRVDKLTLAALAAACRAYLSEHTLTQLPLFNMLSTPIAHLQQKAEKLKSLITHPEFDVEICTSHGQCGGGTLPDLEIPSVAVRIRENKPFRRKQSQDKNEISEPPPSLDRAGLALTEGLSNNLSSQSGTPAEQLFHTLHRLDRPIIGILRGGDFYLDMLTIFDADIEYVAGAVMKHTPSGSA